MTENREARTKTRGEDEDLRATESVDICKSKLKTFFIAYVFMVLFDIFIITIINFFLSI